MKNGSWSAHWRAIASATLLATACGCGGSDGGGTPVDDTGADAGDAADAIVCATGESLCDGVCKPLADDPKNCGACGKTCKAGEVCSAGACAIACPTGQSACNGSCVSFDTDSANCGACGKTCQTGEVCSGGTCATSCGAPFTTCTTGGGGDAGPTVDADPDASDATADGGGTRYCADVKNDRTDCGACGNVCPLGQQCVAGACKLECVTGQDACSDGKCHDLTNDNQNCGACGTACPSGQVCSAGKCGVSCVTGQTLCDDGKCHDLNLDEQNCGACSTSSVDKSCAAGQVCLGGACKLSCQAGLTECTGTCANLQSDNDNCGACGKVCGAGTVCSKGKCETTCATGLTDCSGSCANLQTDNANCGVCGKTCGAGTVCSLGKCETTCATGLTDCTGVCQNLQTDNANCGACGKVCGAGTVCSKGKCETTCASGLTDCSGSCANLQSDNANCGACGKACGAGQSCSGGTCKTTCASGLTDCSGTCANLQSDNANCGACGKTCGAGQACSMGACTTTCAGGLTDCSGSCANLKSDNANCGACGKTCAVGQTCTAGACVRSCATNDDCPASAWGCLAGTCVKPSRDCAEILYFDATAPSGLYVVDPDGLSGPAAPAQVYCDMAAVGGPMTIFYATTGGDNEQPMTGDVAVTGDPHAFQAANPTRAFKAALSTLSQQSVIVRKDGASLTIDHPLFDATLTNAKAEKTTVVKITAGDGTSADAFMGWSNYGITQGGDFGITLDPDGVTSCGTTTVNGFDLHNTTGYRKLNCNCDRHYFYSYSAQTADGDGHYEVHDAIGSWTGTAACDSAEGGGLSFYVGMQRDLTKPFASCAALHAALPSLPDGKYQIDDDGAGSNAPYDVWCDMSGGGYTLLLAATPSGTLFGNNSPGWTTSGVDGTLPTSFSSLSADYRGQAFNTLKTASIRLCYQDTAHCYTFAHGGTRTLLDFFASDVSYVEYSKNIVSYADVSVDSKRDDYTAALGLSSSGYPNCAWIGINHKELSTSGTKQGFSGIGMMGDNNCGCATQFATGTCGANNWLDDYALGLGLQSCSDANSCGYGGTDQPNGRTESVAGIGSTDIGPWLVFGR
jgi:hypothetical protein